jgi:LysR family transcriptional regulator for bpeEF and oprC
MLTTIELSEMEAYVAVVTEGSFTAAARRLGVDKAHISRVIRRMEEKLGAQLIHRSTRRLSPTEAGSDYFERARAILGAAEAAEAAMAQQSLEPRGRLRVTAGAEFGNTRVDGWIADFLKAAPKVTVWAEYTNRFVDIIHEGIDVAIRIGDLENSDLSARKLGELPYGLYASPDYLRGAPGLRTVADLKRHELIMHAPRGRPVWMLVNGSQSERISQTPRCTTNNTLGACNLAVSGLGVVQLPQYLAEPHVRRGGLSRVLDRWARTPAPVHAVFAPSRYVDPKVRGFIDLAASRLLEP